MALAQGDARASNETREREGSVAYGHLHNEREQHAGDEHHSGRKQWLRLQQAAHSLALAMHVIQ